MTEMLIPPPYNLVPPFFNDLSDLVQVSRVHSAGFGKGNGIEPKLGVFLGFFDVNVRWFRALEAEKEKPVAIYTKDFGHANQRVKPSPAAGAARRTR
jgi:hypothetical protein